MTISLVQQVAQKSVSGGSTTKTFTISTPGAGNALRLLIWNASSPLETVSSVTGGGVTWTQVSTVDNSNGTARLWMYRGENSSGSGTTISVTISNTYATFECNISEWSGLDTTPVADPAGTTNTGTSNTVTSASVTPTSGKNLLLLTIGGLTGTTVTNTPSGSFTALTRSATATDVGFAYQIIASASGSFQVTWPAAVSYQPWASIIAGWDASGGGATVNKSNFFMFMPGG